MPGNKIQVILEAVDKTKDAFQGLNNSFKSLGDKFLNIQNLFRTAIYSAPFIALAGAMKKAVETGEELWKISQQIGISVEHLSGLKYAAELSETSLEALTTSIGIFSKGIAGISEEVPQAGEALELLGINTKDSNGNLRDTYDVLLDVADRFSRMEDGAGKTALAMRMFGRSGKELIPLLNEGATGIRAMYEEAERMGLIFSEKSAKAADEFNDNIKRLKENLSGLVITITNEVVPAINDLFQSFSGKGQASIELANINLRIKSLKEILSGEGAWNSIQKLLFPGGADAITKELDDLEKKRLEVLQKYFIHTEPGVLGGKEPAPMLPEKIETQKTDWGWLEMLKYQAGLMSDEEKLIEQIKKEELERWENRIKEEVEYDKYMQAEAEKYQEQQKAAREAELKHRLAMIDLAEQEFKISKPEAIQQRIDANQELLRIQEEHLSLLDKLRDASAWYSQQEAIDQTRQSLLQLNLALKEQIGTFKEGLIEGLNRYQRDAQTAFQGGLRVVQDVTSGMTSAFETFFDYTSDKFMDFGNLAMDILNDIYKAVMKALVIEPLVQGFMGLFTPGAGAEYFNYIPQYKIPAYQSGTDYVPKTGLAWVHRGEQITPAGSKSEPNIQINMHMENKTGLPLKITQTGSRMDEKTRVKTIIFDLIWSDPSFRTMLGVK